MELQHVNVKIYVNGDFNADLARFIDVFHQWIRDQVLDELLIDVVDYRHVPAGPGVVLVALEADYSLDNTGHRLGMRYNRKAPVDGSNEVRFRQALASAAKACRLLEDRFAGEGPLKFSRQEFKLFINDRALAPNTPQTHTACRPEIETFLKNVLGHDDFTLEPRRDPGSRFGVGVKVARPFDLNVLRDMLA